MKPLLHARWLPMTCFASCLLQSSSALYCPTIHVSSPRKFDRSQRLRLLPPDVEDPVRRDLATSAFVFLSTAGVSSSPKQQFPSLLTSASPEDDVESITVPLHYIPKLSAYVVYYSIAGVRFGAILDTGSPFLTIPSYQTENNDFGRYRPEHSRPSGLEPSYECFDNNEGRVEWRKAPFSFIGATGSMMGPTEFIFGVLDEALLDGPGGVFLGLVRDTDKRIRPSFLGQTNVRAFAIDLTSQKSFTLSTTELIPKYEDYIPLVSDLKKRYGDPTSHYTARAQSIQVNGSALGDDRKPIYVIFDTGVTGMVVTRELWDERYEMARSNRERTLWGNVEIMLQTKGRERVSLTAQKPIVTPLGSMPWPNFKNAHLVVVGLAFLEGRRMTVDLDEQKLTLA